MRLRLNPELTVAFTGCTLWHTALIAIHRYLVVVHGDTYQRISKRAYTVFVLVVARAVPFLCVLPGIARGFDGVGYIPKLLRCVLLADQRDRIMLNVTHGRSSNRRQVVHTQVPLLLAI